MKTSELTGAALDWVVAKCEGGVSVNNVSDYGTHYSPSTSWAQGGPIIDREWICVGRDAGDRQWIALIPSKDPTAYQHGPTPLIAAMRCYVAAKLGEEVDIPEGLK